MLAMTKSCFAMTSQILVFQDMDGNEAPRFQLEREGLTVELWSSCGLDKSLQPTSNCSDSPLGEPVEFIAQFTLSKTVSSTGELLVQKFKSVVIQVFISSKG